MVFVAIYDVEREVDGVRVSLIIPSFYPAVVYGGPIFSTLHTCKELASLGVDIKVSTTNANGHTKLDVEANRFLEIEENLKVKYYNETIIRKFSTSLFFGVWQDIRDSDVCHIQSIFSTPTPIALFWCWIFRKPVLLSPRGSLGSWCLASGNRFKKLWLKLLISPFTKRVIWHATSEQEKIEIQKIYPNAKIEVIPNGIDLSEFENIYVEKVPQKIVSMGRLHHVKGFDILIEAFGILKKEFPNATLHIAGQDEGERKKLQNQIDALGLQDSIFLAGEIKEKEKVEFLASGEVFALASHNENFGLVYAEALASGTPIVASQNTPWEDVEKVGCGKWVQNTPQKFAKAMSEVLQSNPSEMGIKGREYVKKFDWKSIALEFKELLERISNEQS